MGGKSSGGGATGTTVQQADLTAKLRPLLGL